MVPQAVTRDDASTKPATAESHRMRVFVIETSFVISYLF
jgi:hypothetical protein